MSKKLKAYVLADLVDDQKLKSAIEAGVLEALGMDPKNSECRLSRSGHLYAVDKRLLFSKPDKAISILNSKRQHAIWKRAEELKEKVKKKLVTLSVNQDFMVMSYGVNPIRDPDLKEMLIGPVHMPHLSGQPHHILVPFSIHIPAGDGHDDVLGYGLTLEVRFTEDLRVIVFNARFPTIARRFIRLEYMPPNLVPGSDHSHPNQEKKEPKLVYPLPILGCNFMVPEYFHFDDHHVQLTRATLNAPTLQVHELRDDETIQLLLTIEGEKIKDWVYQLEILSRQEGYPGQLLISEVKLGEGPHVLPIGACEVAISAESKSSGIRLSAVRQYFSSMHPAPYSGEDSGGQV